MATDLFSAVSASYYNLCDCMDIAKIAFDYFYRKNRNFTKAVQISRKGQHLGHIWNNLVTLKSMKKSYELHSFLTEAPSNVAGESSHNLSVFFNLLLLHCCIVFFFSKFR